MWQRVSIIGRLRENIRELNYNVLDFARVQCHCLANVNGLLSFWVVTVPQRNNVEQLWW